jgi:uncharacterized metal-binding protein
MGEARKVAVYPCGGVGFVLSSVARYAAYLVTEDLLPGKTEIVDAQRLLNGLPDEVALVEENPTIIIDGCGYQCGSNLFRLLGLKPAARLLIPPIAKLPATFLCDCAGLKKQVRLAPGTQRRVPSESGKNLATEVAVRAKSMAEGLLRPNYRYEPQRVRQGQTAICGYVNNIPEEVGYVMIAEGVDRPNSMPRLDWLEQDGGKGGCGCGVDCLP